jgi:hypothetical protein
VPDAALLIRSEAINALHLVSAAQELGYKATTLAYAEHAQKCLVHI